MRSAAFRAIPQATAMMPSDSTRNRTKARPAVLPAAYAKAAVA